MKQVTSGCRRAGSVRRGQHNLSVFSSLALLLAAGCNGQVIGTMPGAGETPAGVTTPGAASVAPGTTTGATGVAGETTAGGAAGIAPAGIATGETPPNAPPSAPQIMPRTEGGFACDPAQKP
ncbi:MAG TPA: hypothetical protein VGF45_00170, partial [Polyangia bacterium]